MTIKLSDFIAEFLAKQGIRHVFAISGGASLHIIDSIAKRSDITYVCPAHEQAGAMAADAYARVTSNLGAALATSGPGATNMMTGVCCAYVDSVPVLYLTGQVATFRLKRDTGVRQMGFQETDTVAVYTPVTKYAVLVDDPRRIRYELEKACYLARSGRPGPVVVDVPDDLQRMQIDPDELEPFLPEPTITDLSRLEGQVERCVELLEQAARPVIIVGWGIRLAKADREAREVLERLGVPIIPTWAMMDFLPADHPLLVGGMGTHGTRYGNFTVQNSDLVLAIGTRLDTHGAGPLTSFAREARKIVVDIDPCELNKLSQFGMAVDVPIQADAGDFLQLMRRRLDRGLRRAPLAAWWQRIAQWKAQYPICPPDYYLEEDINPYVFVKTLAQESASGDLITMDTGCAVAWMMQAFEFKEGQRCFHAFNNTAMGWGLPASIGASFAMDKHPITLVTGDGSLQMSLYELATVIRHQLPIKIFLINNHGYSMIQQTQDQWLDSRYVATTVDSGLAFPDFVKVAQAYGFTTFNLTRNRDLQGGIREALAATGPVFCNLEIRRERRVIPQVKFGRPIEDPEPLLDRQEFLANMIVKPLPESLVEEGRPARAASEPAPVQVSR